MNADIIIFDCLGHKFVFLSENLNDRLKFLHKSIRCISICSKNKKDLLKLAICVFLGSEKYFQYFETVT